MRIIVSILLFLLITACGGGSGSGATDNEKYNTSNYKDLAGTWTPWVSESDYENDNEGYFEIIFSRFGDVYLYIYADVEEITINCFGNYFANGFNQDSSLRCNSTGIVDEFFIISFSSVFDDQTMVIKSFEITNEISSLALFDLDEMTLYKNPPFFSDQLTNVQPGIYEILEIDDIYIQILPDGEIKTIKTNGLFPEIDCEISGVIQTDPDYGLTTKNPVNAVFVEAHQANVDIFGCTINDGIDYLSSKININQNQQASIIRASSGEGEFVIEFMGPGDSFLNEGNNAFYLILGQVCDELGNPSDFADPVDCGILN